MRNANPRHRPWIGGALRGARTVQCVAPSRGTEKEAREARERLRRYTARQTVHARQAARRTRDNRLAIIGVVLVAAVATAAQLFYFTAGPGTPTPVPTASDEPTGQPTGDPTADPTAPPSADPGSGANVGDVPDPSAAEGRAWTGTLDINAIPLGIELDGAAAPQAVASFVTAAADGYYTGKACHRLVSAEDAGLLQCGSLDGTGAPEPGYSYGPIENAPADGVYPAGTIAVARGADDPYSNGRQFFIVVTDTSIPSDSAGGYSVIGRVTTGLDALVAGVTSAGVTGGAQDGPPVVPAVISGLTIQ